MRAQVEYDVPASAVVNTQTGEAESAVAWCEGIEQRDSNYAIVAAAKEEPVSGD